MGGWSTPRSGRFTPGNNTVPIVLEAGWTPGRVRKILLPQGFHPRTAQSVDSRYTNCAIAAHVQNCNCVRLKDRESAQSFRPSVRLCAYNPQTATRIFMTSDFVEYYDKLYSHVQFASKPSKHNTHMHFCGHLQHTQTYPSSHASNKRTLNAITLQSCTAALYQNTTTQLHMSLPLHTSQFPPCYFVGLSPPRQHFDPTPLHVGFVVDKESLGLHPLSVSFHWSSIFIHVPSTLLICLTASLNNTPKILCILATALQSSVTYCRSVAMIRTKCTARMI